MSMCGLILVPVKDHTLFQTKKAKSITLFQTKTVPKTIPFSLYIGSPLPHCENRRGKSSFCLQVERCRITTA